LPVVLIHAKSWSATLRKEHRLRVFENRMLRIIFEPKRKVTGGWRKLHTEELHNLYPTKYCYADYEDDMGGACCVGEMRNVYKVLVGKPERRRSLGRHIRGWDDNIWMDIRERGCEDVDWIHVDQDTDRRRALVDKIMKLQVPQKEGNLLTS
jgi:hypothetical protein